MASRDRSSEKPGRRSSAVEKPAHRAQPPQRGTWGGARKGAGRPKSSDRVGHTPRDRVSRQAPCHVTLRLVDGLPSLHASQVSELVLAALEATKFVRIVRHSVQSNTLHLLIEAASSAALARGMQSFTIRFAKRLNALFDRSGRVFADRFESRTLRSARELKTARALFAK
jgi:hypothetical protein